MGKCKTHKKTNYLTEFYHICYIDSIINLSMYFLKIKYFLYGILISLSLNFIITQANIADGEFGVYFERMTGICNTGEVIT